MIALTDPTFMCADPKSAKIQSSYKCLFVLLGSASIKAAHITLVNLTPEVYDGLAIASNSKHLH